MSYFFHRARIAKAAEVAAPHGVFVRAICTTGTVAMLTELFGTDIQDDLHCTIIYSKEACTFRPPEVPRSTRLRAEATGVAWWDGHDRDGYLVLELRSSDLTALHRELREQGVVPTFEEYHPHVTLRTPCPRESVDVDRLSALVAELAPELEFYYGEYVLLEAEVSKHGDGSHDEADHGNWARGVSAEGRATEFVSPNIEDNLSWDRVEGNLHSARHTAVFRAGLAVNKLVGLPSESHTAVGSWGDGREGSIVTTTASSRDFESVRVAAAMKGLLADQKAVIAFRERPEGKATLYHFDVSGRGGFKGVSSALTEGGVVYHTLVPHQGGVRVFVFSPDGAGADDVNKTAKQLGADALYRTDGDGEFIGSDSSRPRGRAAYREVIERWVAAGGEHNRQGWQELYRNHAERISRVTKSVIGGLFGFPRCTPE